jgi:hypothetical protein
MSREDRAESLHLLGEEEITREDYKLPLQEKPGFPPYSGLYLKGKTKTGIIAGFHSEEKDFYFLIRDLWGGQFAVRCNHNGVPLDPKSKLILLGSTKEQVKAGLQRIVESLA